jgi:hypothetical protein
MQKLVDKSISPLQFTSLTPASVTQGRAANTWGFIPIGAYKGAAAFFDLDKLANQPLIWAEKQWTLDIVDSRNGFATLVVPIGTAPGASVTAVLTVPAGEIWYLGEHILFIHQAATLTAGDLVVNFLVSSFPKTIAGTDKAYLDAARTLVAGFAAIAAAAAGPRTLDTQFQAADELGVPLRLVGGDKLTLVATVATAAVATAAITVDLTVYGRVGKALVL